LSFIIVVYLVVDEITLSEGVVMVQGVDTLGLCEAIIDILLHVKAIHEDECRWPVTLEQLLLERVTVLAVVDYDFAIGCGCQPFVVWL